MIERAVVLIDFANLREGHKARFDPELLTTQLDAIDHCCSTLFGVAATEARAFTLEGIPGEAELTALRSRGYEIVASSRTLTATMQAKNMSRLDDYVLQREAKRLATQGADALLVISADRGHEIIAEDLAGQRVRVVFAQWPELSGRPGHVERIWLQDHISDFAGSAAASVESLPREPLESAHAGPEASSDTGAHSATEQATIIELRRRGRCLRRFAIFDGFTIGRASRNKGRPDLALDEFVTDTELLGSYSRQLAVVRHADGRFWLHRLPNASGMMALRIAPEDQELPPGATVLLEKAPISLGDIDLELCLFPGGSTP